MKLNRFETLLMNNPVRTFSLRRIEAPLLMRWIGDGRPRDILEIGCGRGVGACAIAARFGAARIVAFDYDPAQVGRAKRWLGRRAPGEPVSFAIADAERLPFPDTSFDVVFEFGILHHVPGWRQAVREALRVLKPGGRFALEDLGSRFADNRLVSLFFEHPRGLGIGPSSMKGELVAAGFQVERYVSIGEIAMAAVARKP